MRLARFARIRGVVLTVAVATFAAFGTVVTGDAPQEPRVPPTESAPTFSADVAPIMYRKCVSCHRPGEIAPMSFITYKDVRPWARSIREKVLAREMPPWDADPQHGKFRNDRSLTQQEIDTIVKWANAGARQGNPSAMPALPTFAAGWQIGTPDVVFEMPVEYQIPADGTIDYQYFEVPTNFKEDRWMQAGEVRAGDPEHVHHIIVSVIEPERSTRPNVVSIRPIVPEGQTPTPRPQRERAEGSQAGQLSRRASAVMLVNWAVGEDAPILEPGTAKERR